MVYSSNAFKWQAMNAKLYALYADSLFKIVHSVTAWKSVDDIKLGTYLHTYIEIVQCHKQDRSHEHHTENSTADKMNQ